MLRSLELTNLGPVDRMTFVPGKRLNVITGDNGLGKSFLLDIAWWAVTRTWAGLQVKPQLDSYEPSFVDISFAAVTRMAKLRVDYDRADQTWRFPKGQPGEPGLVVYARVDGDFAVWDSNRRFGGADEAESGVPKGLVFSRDQVWNGLQLNDRPICNGLLADWTSWIQTGSWEATALSDALVSLSPSEGQPVAPGKPTRVDLLDSRLIPTLRMPYGPEIPITHASAGMKRVIALAYLLVWAWREHLEVSRIAGRDTAERMLVIIDEVEAHLHPKWQRVILSAIVNALETLTAVSPENRPHARPPKIQYIVATHSPLVLASVEPIFELELDALFELQLREEPGEAGAQPHVVLVQPEFRRHGDADRWLTSDSFGLSSSRSVQAESVINDAADLFEGNAEPAAEALSAMEERLSGVLSDIDPFWTRWRALTSRDHVPL